MEDLVTLRVTVGFAGRFVEVAGSGLGVGEGGREEYAGGGEVVMVVRC